MAGLWGAGDVVASPGGPLFWPPKLLPVWESTPPQPPALGISPKIKLRAIKLPDFTRSSGKWYSHSRMQFGSCSSRKICSESKKVQVSVTLSCPILCDLMDSGKNTGVGCRSFFQGIFLTQGSNPDLLHCRQILYSLNHQGSPSMTR